MRRRIDNPESPNQRGARLELIAAAALMAEGFIVYRNLSSEGPDLIAQKRLGGTSVLLRIEVKSTRDYWRSVLKTNDVLIVVQPSNLVPRIYTSQRNANARWLSLFESIEVIRKKP